MRTGLYVLCVFAAIWGGGALYGLGLHGWYAWVGPMLISLLLALLLGPRTPSTADRSPEDRRRAGRLVAIWSGAEGVAIPIAAFVLANTGHARLFFPVMALIVGLHFFPLARGLPFRAYYATGAAVVLAALASLFAPGPQGPMIAAGGACALIFWATLFVFPRSPA